MKEKKKWVKPELVVLVRRKTEEAVLTACSVTRLLAGPHWYNNGCYFITGCSRCSDYVPS